MITVNAHFIIGNHVKVFKGVTIGEVEHSEKAGNPTIGNHVTICTSATICGANNNWV